MRYLINSRPKDWEYRRYPNGILARYSGENPQTVGNGPRTELNRPVYPADWDRWEAEEAEQARLEAEQARKARLEALRAKRAAEETFPSDDEEPEDFYFEKLTGTSWAKYMAWKGMTLEG